MVCLSNEFRDELVVEIIDRAKVYLQDDDQLRDQNIPVLIAEFAIDTYIKLRNYPDSFSVDKVETDINSNRTWLSMAVVDLFSKYGAEGETEHREKNITRVYNGSYVSKRLTAMVTPYVHVL